MNKYVFILLALPGMSSRIAPAIPLLPGTGSRVEANRESNRAPALLDCCAASKHDIALTRSSIMSEKPSLAGELLAEFLGTFVLMLFGIGVVAMVVVFPSNNPGETIHGGFTNITLGWGLAVTMGIYVAGKVSGAHLNPAVTLSVAVFRGFPWRKVVPYSLAQTAGAFVAAALVYWNYLPAFQRADPLLEHTAGVFTTFPAFPAIPQAGFLDQFIGTALLILLIFAITDEYNSPPGSNMAPLMIGLVVVAIGMSFGGMHGYAINPARDFGPRLFTVVAGFRNNGLTDGTHVWWVPIVAPLLGGLAGAAVYDFGIRRFLRRN
jgi:glycerol uptake facilitator protein